MDYFIMADVLLVMLFVYALGDIGQNRALYKETKQISIFDNRGDLFSSSYAVDGDIESRDRDSAFNCTHTKTNHINFWWTVDLRKEYVIKSVVIYGRTDCCEHRLANYDILLYNPIPASWDNYDKQPGQLCYRQNGMSPTILNVTCRAGVKGRYLKVLKEKNTTDNEDALTLCEVQVYGDELNENGNTEPMCPCSCSYKARREYWANQVIPNHTTEEWRQILAPVLDQIDRELRIDKQRLSTNRHRKQSANDNRKSAKSLGILGAALLAGVIALVVFIDISTMCNEVKSSRMIRSRVP